MKLIYFQLQMVLRAASLTLPNICQGVPEVTVRWDRDRFVLWGQIRQGWDLCCEGIVSTLEGGASAGRAVLHSHGVEVRGQH